MSPEAQRIAIAEACGYSDVRMQEWESVDIESRSIAFGIELQGTLNGERKFVPDYLNDLNAMHGAENTLTPAQCITYAEWLACYKCMAVDQPITGPKSFMWGATAAQRAEAFLRTIGKWEGQP
jgi:hypothetical protein